MLIHLVKLEQASIFEQLQLEEALLRADADNWCIVNTGSPPAIVMGISGNPEKLINLHKYRENPIPLIRRFSGGGTVVVDDNTVFVTWIINEGCSLTSCCPKKILDWTLEVYRDVFPGFEVRENDYVFDGRKFGGNAQYMRKQRWLHHTSFLWDYCPERMEYLLMPPKTPAYRAQRDHRDFLCKVKDRLASKEFFLNSLMNIIHDRFQVVEKKVEEITEVHGKDHRKSTTYVDLS